MSPQTPDKLKKRIMLELLLAILAGFLVGMIFSAIKLPLPAPPVLAGILGIVGIYLGGATWKIIAEKFFSQ
jgi:XapX domain-containing protein